MVSRYRLQDKTIRSEYQVQLGIQANEFLKSLDNLHQEGIVEEELVHRMASKWE